MSPLARTLIFAGLGLVALGALVWLLARTGLPLGNLPGDFSWQSGNARVYVPLTTMLLVSLVLTVLVNVVGRLFR